MDESGGDGKFTGHVRACHYVMNVNERRNKLQRALRQIVERELDVIPGAPPQCFVERSRELIRRTRLVRTQLYRARIDEFGESLVPIRRGKTAEKAVPKLLDMLNGDFRRAPVTHYCSGCCRNEDGVTTREQQVDNVVAAIAGAGLFGGAPRAAPAKSRRLSVYDCL
ncbi:unnamed protein product, partial [Prorocentrum cordatum]